MLARALLVTVAACGATPVHGPTTPAPLTQASLMATIEYLAHPDRAGRAAGSPGELDAGVYVVKALKAAGLEPVYDDVPEANSRNVRALVRGRTDELIVVGAHLDHLGVRDGRMYPGADDDASGVAAVLDIARALPRDLQRGVLFVWFGAEELGMVGSRHFVAQPPVPLERIRAMVNIDMIGRPLVDRPAFRPLAYLAGIDRDRAIGLYGVRHHAGLRALADAAFRTAGGQVVAPEDLPAFVDAEVERQAAGRGDSVPFEDKGIPALFFGDGESSDYHQPTDTVATIDRALLARHARAIARLVADLANAPASAFAATTAAQPRRIPRRGLYLPIGVAAGVRGEDGAHAIAGAEASLVYATSSLAYGGAYGDVLASTGAAPARASAGVELGKRWLGIDAGYVAELGGAHRRGVAVRAFATAAVLSLTARVGTLDGTAYAELGVLAKLPVRL